MRRSLSKACRRWCQLAVCCGYCWAAAAMAAGTSFDCGKQPIRLAFYEFGYFYFDQGKGIDKDVVDELGKRSACRFETQVMARARIWAELESGDLDMSVSGVPDAERERYARFAPYLISKNYTLLSRQVASKVRGPEDFIANPALQFGVVRTFLHGEKLDQWLLRLRQAGRVQESPAIEAVFRKLKENRVDALYSHPIIYRKLLNDLAMQGDFVVQDWAPGEKGVKGGLVLAKKRFSEAESAQWQRLIDEMRADGTLRRIYRRYLPEEEAARLLDF